MGLAIFRAASLLLTVALVGNLSLPMLTGAMFAISISHYITAFLYSGPQLRYLAANARFHATPLAILTASIVAACWFDAPSTYLLFALHHVCNEAYFAQARFRQNGRFLVASRAIFHAAVYFAATRGELSSHGFDLGEAGWALTLAAAALSLGFFLFRDGRGEKKDLAYEGVFLGAAALTFWFGPLTFDHVLIYHFLFWGMYPVQKLSGQGRLAPYLALNAGLLTLFALFTPLGPHWGELSLAQLNWATRIGAYFHILSSFALSRAHPAWIRAWFFAPERNPAPLLLPAPAKKSA